MNCTIMAIRHANSASRSFEPLGVVFNYGFAQRPKALVQIICDRSRHAPARVPACKSWRMINLRKIVRKNYISEQKCAKTPHLCPSQLLCERVRNATPRRDDRDPSRCSCQVSSACCRPMEKLLDIQRSGFQLGFWLVSIYGHATRSGSTALSRASPSLILALVASPFVSPPNGGDAGAAKPTAARFRPMSGRTLIEEFCVIAPRAAVCASGRKQ